MVQNPAASSGAEFVQGLIAHDPAAWQEVFENHFQGIFRLAYARTMDRAAAEDIAAEVFAEAFRGIKRYEYRGLPFRAWLYRIASNTIADHLKTRSRRPAVSLAEVEDLLPAAEEDIEGRADLVAAIGTLPVPQQRVLLLRFVNFMSLQEVAQVMGKSLGAIKQLQFRAVAALREKLVARQ
jgi:RNA polymerase sigma-70 factor (ECF subfamily)